MFIVFFYLTFCLLLFSLVDNAFLINFPSYTCYESSTFHKLYFFLLRFFPCLTSHVFLSPYYPHFTWQPPTGLTTWKRITIIILRPGHHFILFVFRFNISSFFYQHFLLPPAGNPCLRRSNHRRTRQPEIQSSIWHFLSLIFLLLFASFFSLHWQFFVFFYLL